MKVDQSTPPRLKSRKPFHREVEALRLDAEEKHPGKKWLRDRWQSEWQNNSSRLRAFLPEASKCSGTSLPRRCWVQLNRARTGIGRTMETLHRWKMTDSPNCACGVRQTLKHFLTCKTTRAPNGEGGLRSLDADTIKWLEHSSLWATYARRGDLQTTSPAATGC